METTTSDPLHSIKQSVKMSRKAHQLMKNHPSMRLLSALTLPKESPPVRCGRAYGSDPTAAVKLFNKQNVQFPSNNFGDLGPNEFSQFAFRNALRSSITCFGLVAGDYSHYRSSFSVNVTGSRSYPVYDGPMVPVMGPVTPHGQALYYGRLGKSDGHRGILCSKNNQLVVQLDAQSSPLYNPGTLTTVVLSILRGSEWVAVADGTFATASGLVPFVLGIAETGYYAIDFKVTQAIVTGVIPVTRGYTEVQILNPASSYPGMVWAQRALPQIEDILPTVDAIRITGVSAMYTNTSSPLYRQGQITGLQVPKNLMFTSVFDQNELSILAKSQTIDVVNGMYGFLKPTAVSDLEMQVFEYVSQEGENVVEHVFDIYPASDYLAICATVSDPNGKQGYYTHAFSVEYETFNQWAELQTSEISAPQLDMALRALTSVPQWHTNSFHIEDIWGWIKDAAGAVWGGVKEVASVVGPVLPLAAAFL